MKRFSVLFAALLLVLAVQDSFAGRLYARRAGTETPVYNLILSKISTTVNIYGQLAVTHVDEEFFNDNNLTLEGFYVFQLPEGAKVDGLWLWENGVRRRFIVLSKEEAERKYDSVVNPQRPPRDPAILESLGANRFQLKVFPILPNSSRRVEIQYFHTLPLTPDGVVQYRYPLNLQGYQTAPVENTDMTVMVHSYQRIQALTTNFDAQPLLNRITKLDDFNYEVNFGIEQTMYTQDYILEYKPEGIYQMFPTLAWDDPDDEDDDGYFITWHGFKDESGPTEKRDIVFVLDASGSMAGDRIQTVRDAVEALLPQLKATDQFRIVLFSSHAVSFPEADGLLAATKENIDAAIEYINTHYIFGGSTNYEEAFVKALSADFREEATKKMVFLTDGEPTVGAITYSSLLNTIEYHDESFVAIYPILFYTEKIELLYDIASARGGTTTEVQQGDDLQTVIERILFELGQDGFRNVEIRYMNDKTYFVYPRSFGALTSSTQFITTGRYEPDGKEKVEMSYRAKSGQDKVIERDVDFMTTLINVPEVGSYWAAKRIDDFLDEVKEHGETPELIESIIKLSIKHSILTPYTAFLVLETNEIDPPTNLDVIGTMAQSFELAQNYPNPFSLNAAAVTTIPFTLAEGAEVRIVITDLLGRVIKILAEGQMPEGSYNVTWDGTNELGELVAPGTYLIRMSAGPVSLVKMMSVVR